MSSKRKPPALSQHAFLLGIDEDYAGEQMMPTEPACAVPFAYRPGTTVTEKFTVEIKTEETGEYCACARCVAARSTVLSEIVRVQVQRFLDYHDPFYVFPEKQVVSVRHNQTVAEGPR